MLQSKWGPISPAHVIYGVASALQETREKFYKIAEAVFSDNNTTDYYLSDSTEKVLISNVWVSTVAGDLGEVVLNQAFVQPLMGNEGAWNDTLYPRLHFLNAEQWDMSRAELLGGFDGKIYIVYHDAIILLSTILKVVLKKLIS